MKTIFQRTAALLLVLVILISALPTASASVTGTVTRSDKVNSSLYFWGGSMQTFSFSYADGAAVTYRFGGFCLHYVDGKIAYCIEPQVGTTTNTTYSGDVLDCSPYWKNKLTANQRKAISLILLYGAPNSLYSSNAYTEFGYEGATQILIWEIVMGLRSSVAPYTRTNSSLYTNFQHNSTFPSLDTAYSQIASRLQSHGVIPSFASKQRDSAPEIVLHYNESTGICSGTVTDKNGVLANDYSFSASGVTFSKNGNTLSISAPYSVLASGDVIASAKGRSLAEDDLGAMIWTCPSKQTLIKTVETSNDPLYAYIKLVPDSPPGTMTVKKESDTGDVSGYCFKMYQWSSNRSWYGKSDSSGKVYLTDSSYAQSGSTKTYTFTGMTDGNYTFLEVLSQTGNEVVFPDSWRIVISNCGIYLYDHTFTASDFEKDANGDCRLNKIALTGLSGGGVMEMTIHNAAITMPLEIIKQSDDGKVSGISFNVEQYVSGTYQGIGTYQTDAAGKITIPNIKTGAKYRITEVVPQGYTCEQNSQEITLGEGTNKVTFINHRDTVPPKLTIVKQADDGNVSDIEFEVCTMGGQKIFSGSTNAKGELEIDSDLLKIGDTYIIIESEKPGYICQNNYQKVSVQEGENKVTFINHLIHGSLKILKVDAQAKTPLSGAGYRLYDSNSNKIAEAYTDLAGIALFENLPYGKYYYQEFEAPEGFVLDETRYEVSIRENSTTVTKEHENTPDVASIHIHKVDDVGTSLSNVCFLLEYSVDNGANWMPVQYRTADSKVFVGGCTSERLENGLLETGEDGIVSFTGLCRSNAMGAVKYRLTETATAERYLLLTEPAFEDYLPATGETDISLTVVNVPEFTIPETGKNGFVGTAIGFGLAISALSVLLFSTRKKKAHNQKKLMKHI